MVESFGYQISHRTFFDEINVNNAGDPFFRGRSFYQFNSHDDERALIRHFAYNLLQCEEFSLWGYCASGSTESILNGLWMARKRFSKNKESLPATVYASSECHFCVPKAADMLCMPFVEIPCLPDTGQMNMNILAERIATSGTPAVVVLTLGTTIRNAFDNLDVFFSKIQNRNQLHVHLDAAFGGAVYPFTKPGWLKHSFDTFNVSFHKFWGCPYPCSLFLVKKDIMTQIQGNGCFGKEMVCLPNKDFTISCSRNGTAVSLVKNMLCDKGFTEKHVRILNKCFQTKDFFVKWCVDNGIRHRTNDDGLSVELLGLSMRFEKEMRETYSLNVRNIRENRFDTHVYFCGHVTPETLEAFIQDVKRAHDWCDMPTTSQ